MIDGGLGTRGQADEKQRGRQQTTTTKNKPLPSRLQNGKKGSEKTREKKKKRERERERGNGGKNGKINYHKVV